MRLLYKKTVTLSWRHTGERFLFVRRWRHAALARFPGRWPSGGVYPRPWLRVILRLSPHCQRSALRERRKILIDLPGFGYSDKPRVFSYNIHEQALVLEQFLSHLRLQRFALFGHSMGGSIAIEAAGLLGERVTTLLVSEPNLFAGGGEYSRRIAAQSETAFVADGYARLLAEERSPWAGCLQNCAPWAVWRAASSLIRGSDTPWFTQLCQLRCQKMLIVGERSLPYADSDLVQAQGIPVGIVPHAGHSMAWENPQGLAQLIASHS
ncbi:alpha/beta fold hydrolase [Klebsiella pneumoniae]|uniref:alpha/beta fold hydrolase n=2 Tax=Klebsiella pneumoniae TaxID=573 RepID=UPI0038576207